MIGHTAQQRPARQESVQSRQDADRAARHGDWRCRPGSYYCRSVSRRFEGSTQSYEIESQVAG